jgi:hypothetical protein
VPHEDELAAALEERPDPLVRRGRAGRASTTASNAPMTAGRRWLIVAGNVAPSRPAGQGVAGAESLPYRIAQLVSFMAPAYVANMAPLFSKYWKGWNAPISRDGAWSWHAGGGRDQRPSIARITAV